VDAEKADDGDEDTVSVAVGLSNAPAGACTPAEEPPPAAAARVPFAPFSRAGGWLIAEIAEPLSCRPSGSSGWGLRVGRPVYLDGS
jgi:hypothetical protein